MMGYQPLVFPNLIGGTKDTFPTNTTLPPIIPRGAISTSTTQLPPTSTSQPSANDRHDTIEPPQSSRETGSKLPGTAVPYQSEQAARELQKIDQPWPNWSHCNPLAAFEDRCHPKPATCRHVQNATNNHGIGNALEITYVKVASESLRQKPDCAPIIHDKPVRPIHPGEFSFQLLDYVKEPSWVVQPSKSFRDFQAKCLAFLLTQPKQVVTDKVQAIQQQYSAQQHNDKQHYPLVAMHLRTGWSDEMQRNVPGWDGLGSCEDYQNQFPVDMAHHAVSDLPLKQVILDFATAADRVFGAGGNHKQWRLYVASDAPGIRNYVRHLLHDRVVGPIVWQEGRIGHNYQGGMATSLEEKVATSVSAFTDLVIMSEADMLVCISSRFPSAANLRSGGCPQRFAEVGAFPRHELAIAGDLLHKAWTKYTSKSKNTSPGAITGSTPWCPALDEEAKAKLFDAIPGGRDNPCTTAVDPIRACFCLLKLSHA
ncbi:expressed unknown protein [Seminavis robusta]|uniref:Uncharacterized protein n=1 Tax=Seminavis robusta TaxID=568900 RepID=A0A9N8HRI0_9STRA|nr:expressed unknown protein [Seminavis robusta]|eukprot:Sro1571_g283340.1 n/a (482) ;mRNA; f:12652-14097